MQRNLPIQPLTAITPIDGRYFSDVSRLQYYFSEFALIKERLTVEILYLQSLSKTDLFRDFTENEIHLLSGIYQNFSLKDAEEIKTIEQITRHDVKAIEYFLKKRLKNTTAKDLLEMIHFGVTSEDISNLAFNRLVKNATNDYLLVVFEELIKTLVKRAGEWKDIAMIGRTHGKDAPATTVGKEIALFAHRLAKKYERLKKMKITGKLTGVVGNFHELSFANTDIDWIKFSTEFILTLGLTPQLFTTQIEPHDTWSELCNVLCETAVIIKSFDQNMWQYISHDYFTLPPKEGQIGSSVMPHKGRNPIGLENSEGNAILAISIFTTLANELPNSRFQRHLSDTTLSRNIGTAYAYLLLSIQNAKIDSTDLVINEAKIQEDLKNKWGIVTATLQTKLRLLGIKGAYEKFDEMAKQNNLSKENIVHYINTLHLSKNVENELLTIGPSYSGKARELTEMMIEEVAQLLQ